MSSGRQLRTLPVTFHIVGDAYVDFLLLLQGSLPELGGDSTLKEPVQTFAGGSTINTATHLQHLCRHFWDRSNNGDGYPPYRVVIHTAINPGDGHGKLLQKHAEQHDFDLINCGHKDDAVATSSLATPHCVVIVADGDRSFMTHRGCAEHFTGRDLDITTHHHANGGPIHLHIAGFYCTPGFGDGSLRDYILSLKQGNNTQSTIISLVPQFDVSEQWDGGIVEIIPHLSLLIMNELEANKLLKRGVMESASSEKASSSEDEWISHFSSLSDDTVFVITRGADRAIAFRNRVIIGHVAPVEDGVDAIDPTGAGDAFCSGFLHGLWKTMNNCELSDDAVREALHWGCAVGTAAVTVRGASIPSSPRLIEDLLEKQKRRT